MSMLCEIPWSTFRNSGSLWFVNRILHLFGLAIVFEMGTGEDGEETVKRVYPARCKFRGFDEASETDGFQKLTSYMHAMGDVLVAETRDEGDVPAVQPAIVIPAGTLKPGTAIRIHGSASISTSSQAKDPSPQPPPAPPRIHVADLDPDTLVGIAPCDDGSEGWVVMGVQPDPDEPDKEIVAPIGDEFGQIVYLDINDAVEVLKTGKVWKHDMGEGVADPKPTTPTE